MEMMEGNANVVTSREDQKPPSPFQIQPQQIATPSDPNYLRKILMVTSLAAGVNFGWALQLSLLTPYVQLLGIPHTWAGYIWLCGPITGMLVQPIVGYHSDRCTSRYGRRRPFIAAGAGLVAIAVFLIGFAADLGHLFGDEDAEKKKSKPRAIAVFVVGFWIYDVANNMLAGPCRALLADLSGSSQKKTRTANTLFSFFMAVGNVLGFATGSFSQLYKMFPFTKTQACDVYCANLKSCFLIDIVLILTLTALALTLVTEIPLSALENGKSASIPVLGQIKSAFLELKRPMWILLLVTAFNWLAWIPFLLYDTDWMGREVYGGKVGEGRMYDLGVHAGSLGLMLNSAVLGFTSLGVEFMARRVGVKKLWGGVNFLLAVCLGMTVLITKLAEANRRFSDVARTQPSPPPAGIKAGALTIFAVLGVPLAVSYTIPFALASIFSNDSGAGQGLSMGVLNLANVIPQFIVSLTAGPWDELFGGGNLPAFIVATIAAAVSGVLALTILPSPPPDHPTVKISGAPQH